MTMMASAYQPSRSEFPLMPKSATATISSILCEVEVVRGEHPGGRIQKSQIGDMVMLRSTMRDGRVTAARSDRLIRRSSTDDFLLGMVVKGKPLLRQGGREAQLSAGEMILIDSKRRYELEIIDELDLICLKIARRSVETRIMDHGRYLGLALKTEHGLGYVAGKMLEACIATAPYLDASDGRRFESSFIDIMGSAFRCQIDNYTDPNVGHAYRIFNRVREYIEDHLDDPALGPSMISQNVGLSERYLRKMFAIRNSTLMGWIRTRRLQKCHQAISSGVGDYASLAEIAYAHGFNDISNFNRSFKNEFGVTPSEVRQSSRAIGH